MASPKISPPTSITINELDALFEASLPTKPVHSSMVLGDATVVCIIPHLDRLKFVRISKPTDSEGDGYDFKVVNIKAVLIDSNKLAKDFTANLLSFSPNQYKLFKENAGKEMSFSFEIYESNSGKKYARGIDKSDANLAADMVKIEELVAEAV